MAWLVKRLSISRCTKRRFLRVEILCQETRHMTHHWKVLGEESWIVPNLGLEIIPGVICDHFKLENMQFHKIGHVNVMP